MPSTSAPYRRYSPPPTRPSSARHPCVPPVAKRLRSETLAAGLEEEVAELNRELKTMQGLNDELKEKAPIPFLFAVDCPQSAGFVAGVSQGLVQVEFRQPNQSIPLFHLIGGSIGRVALQRKFERSARPARPLTSASSLIDLEVSRPPGLKR